MNASRWTPEMIKVSDSLRLWTQADAVQLCRRIETVAPEFGFHVALTGGCLYKDGPRKDCDVLFYSIRQCPNPDREGLLEALRRPPISLVVKSVHGWVCKAEVEGLRKVDLFFPETKTGAYPPS